MRILILIILCSLLFSCNNQSNSLQSSSQVIMEFKQLCWQGNFNEAKDFLVADSSTQNKFKKDIENYKSLTNNEKVDLLKKSVIVYSIKKITSTQDLFIISSNKNTNDTIICNYIDGSWKIALK